MGIQTLVTTKGRELLNAIGNGGYEFQTSRNPTYWATDSGKIPDLIDFYVTKGISSNYLEVDNIDELSSDHVPVMMILSSTIIRKKKKATISNRYTDWDEFREKLDHLIELKVRFKTTEDLNEQAQNFVEIIHKAASSSTSVPKDVTTQDICYPAEIREMIKRRRKARRIWQQTRHPDDKNTFNLSIISYLD